MRKWMDKVKTMKKEQILILLLCGALLLVIAIPTGDSPQQQDISVRQTESTSQAANIEGYAGSDRALQLERRLKSILGKVEGIGKTEVMLTLKSGGKKIIEKDLEQSQGKEENQGENTAGTSDQVNSSESTVYQRDAQGNELPYITEELEPEIAGVLVIAQGAGNASVAAEITEAVMALFGVEAHKIKVMKME